MLDSKAQILAWHYLQLSIPDSWNPVKIEGDAAEGMMLLTDMQAAKLGLRWKKIRKSNMAGKIASQLLRDELGKLAADEAVDYPAMGTGWGVSKLYIEPDPPGRDMWVGFSEATQRMVQVVYHTGLREGKKKSVLSDQLLPQLVEKNKDEPAVWSVFDLSCQTPVGYDLKWYRLNAGDLTLVMEGQSYAQIQVRQIAPARLALSRQKMDGWLIQQQQYMKKLYRRIHEKDLTDYVITVNGKELVGKKAIIRRRRRFFFAWRVPKLQTLVGLHDALADRLYIVQSTDEQKVDSVVKSMGWAGNH